MRNAHVPVFPGINPPSTDFPAVRDGRRARVFYYDLDLSTARSIAAGTALILNIAGNSFFADQSPSQGNATVYFQDFTLQPTDAPPIYVGPGFVGTVPFTTLLIENTAQAGKRCRFFYGVDVDFKPSLSGSIALTGTINSIETGFTYGAAYKSQTALAANTPDTIFAPGANINGAILWHAAYVSNTSNYAAFVSKNAAPVSTLDGDVILIAVSGASGFSTLFNPAYLPRPVRIPAGQGLYRITAAAEGGNTSTALYSLL